MSRVSRAPVAAVAAAALAAAFGVPAGAQAPTPAHPGGPPPLAAVVQWHGTPSGLKSAEIVVGSGASPHDGQTVVVHFTGWLDDGAQFDSSRDRKKPFGFALGSGQVIKGWDEGVRGMRVGGKRRLVVPASLGYGTAGIPGLIPPAAALTFDVELLRIVDQ